MGSVLAVMAAKCTQTANQALKSTLEDDIHLLPICALRVKVTIRP